MARLSYGAWNLLWLFAFAKVYATPSPQELRRKKRF
jgi:hypothetical protein